MRQPKLRKPRTYQPRVPPRVLLGVSLPVPVAAGILSIADLEGWSTSKVLAHIVSDFFKDANREPLIKHLLATLTLNRALSRDAVKLREDTPQIAVAADHHHQAEPPKRVDPRKGRPLSPEHRAAILRGVRRAKRARAAAAKA